ncbi:hypothetical protein Bbelb_209220 [Branchiostoma belcheri]|nr:hypothetical protein Bbelb_209220 [Branchiostoma belcheri]
MPGSSPPYLLHLTTFSHQLFTGRYAAFIRHFSYEDYAVKKTLAYIAYTAPGNSLVHWPHTDTLVARNSLATHGHTRSCEKDSSLYTVSGNSLLPRLSTDTLVAVRKTPCFSCLDLDRLRSQGEDMLRGPQECHLSPADPDELP